MSEPSTSEQPPRRKRTPRAKRAERAPRTTDISMRLTIVDMGEPTPAYRALWRLLLSPLPEEVEEAERAKTKRAAETEALHKALEAPATGRDETEEDGE